MSLKVLFRSYVLVFQADEKKPAEENVEQACFQLVEPMMFQTIENSFWIDPFFHCIFTVF